MFQDYHFDGGKYALMIGSNWERESPDQGANCSENMMVDCLFTGGRFGFRNGHWNALNNLIMDGFFKNNQIAMGANEEDSNGGSWLVLRAVIENTFEKDLDFCNSAGNAWYFQGLVTDSDVVFKETTWSVVSYPVFFDQCFFDRDDPDSAVNSITYTNSGALFFLHSEIHSMQLKIDAKNAASNVAFNLHSLIPDWDDSELVEFETFVDFRNSAMHMLP